LRVMNDDVIAPGSGFDMHPHNDMEIITYVISGELTHVDSMGHRETIGRGDVQYMSAGTGIMHSETNEGSVPVHLIQTWIFPRAKHLKPRYGSVRFLEAQRANRWLHFAGPDGADTPVQLHQDANLYAAELKHGNTLTFEPGAQRQLYVKVMEGDVMMNGVALAHGDAAEAANETLSFSADDYAHLLLIEMAKDQEG
jgi:redox-sensitive bicupin YhaK (pirin superfamily)